MMTDDKFVVRRKETTCKCILECRLKDHFALDKYYNFHKGREYQLDILMNQPFQKPYKVYQNGEYSDFVLLNEEQFNSYFELIK